MARTATGGGGALHGGGAAVERRGGRRVPLVSKRDEDAREFPRRRLRRERELEVGAQLAEQRREVHRRPAGGLQLLVDPTVGEAPEELLVH